MDMLERAIAIAVEAHAGQVDKAGAPYILHPLRVMLAVSNDCKETAVLHDVVEDSDDWTLERLAAEGFHPIVLSALDHLTRRDGENYADFIERCRSNSIARAVKKADVMDNMGRLGQLPPAERSSLFDRYDRALKTLAA